MAVAINLGFRNPIEFKIIKGIRKKKHLLYNKIIFISLCYLSKTGYFYLYSPPTNEIFALLTTHIYIHRIALFSGSQARKGLEPLALSENNLYILTSIKIFT